MHSPNRAVQPVLDDLRRIVRALREWSQSAVEQAGLSGAQVFVLESIGDSPGLSLNQVAARTRTHQSTVSVVVSRLVARGLVKRVTSRDDGRRLELILTRAGRAALARMPESPQHKLISAIDRLSPRARTQLGEGLRKLVATMHLADEVPQMFFQEPERGRKTRRGR
jgi:MarR family transcriptional regulator, lower aerobic nicotinate degradation pathway regulator